MPRPRQDVPIFNDNTIAYPISKSKLCVSNPNTNGTSYSKELESKQAHT